jgi:PelA/Pel-15E family pectate lyase
MSTRKISILILFIIAFSGINAQSLRIIRNDLFQDSSWYGNSESLNVAENVLLLQKNDGGWPKNIRFYKKILSPYEIQDKLKLKEEIMDATIDNGATYSEMVFLAKMYQATKNEKYSSAFIKGMDFIFLMQYENGGFRQFDRNKGYYTHITFNDNATYNIMQLLRAVVGGNPIFDGIVTDSLKIKAKKSFDRGIDCILKTQYVQNGKKTIWCAQHDEFSLKPAKARAYELPSLSGAESVGLVQLLMEIPNPDERIKDAVIGAIEWFEKSRISDHRIQHFINSEGKPDIRWIKSSEGEDLWGRFCDLETNRAFVCDRDGIIKYDISEIGYERRNGYGWYTSEPAKIIAKFAKWKERNM